MQKIFTDKFDKCKKRNIKVEILKYIYHLDL